MYRKELPSDWITALIGAILLCLLAPLTFTAGGLDIPITLQGLLVVWIPLVTGWRAGALAVMGYLVAGGLGLPVFAEGTSGWERFSGATGGFLFGFAIAAVLVGWAAEWWADRGREYPAAAGVMLILSGQILLLALGLSWYYSIIPLREPLIQSLEIWLQPVLLKTAMGGLIFTLVGRILGRTKQQLT
jgi:biotin transport system substrate-specific component